MIRFSLKELLFPTKCIFCCQLQPDQSQEICPECRGKLPLINKLQRKIPFTCGCTALWEYDNLVRSSLLRFKFSRKRHYARCYGQELAKKLRSQGVQFDLITWAPVSTRRKLRRGYDQGQLLSHELGYQMNIEVKRCLRKSRNTPPQSTIKDEAQRRANVLGVYRPVNQPAFLGKRILLVDDIITTGSTISECAKVLMMAGAKEVYCAAIATAKKHK